MKNLRIPMTLEYREVRVSGSGSAKSYWKQWGSAEVSGHYETDTPSLEGDLKVVEKQSQERRGGMITIRYNADIASKISAKWRATFRPMPGMAEETHNVRGFALEPKEGRSRFIVFKVEREVK